MGDYFHSFLWRKHTQTSKPLENSCNSLKASGAQSAWNIWQSVNFIWTYFKAQCFTGTVQLKSSQNLVQSTGRTKSDLVLVSLV